MKTNLQQLVEHLLTEKSNLEKSIQEKVEEMDYLSAHYLVQGLGKINRELQLLTKFDHTNELALHRSKANLAAFEAKVKREGEEDQMAQWKNERILERLKNQIEAIEKQPSRKYIDDQKIDDLIVQLLDHQINGFRWYLNRADNFYLEFNLFASQTLAIAFTPLMYLNSEEWLVDEKQLEGLEFYFSTGSDRWQRHVDITHFKNTILLKQWLSRIVFEVLLYHEMDEEMTVEVY